MDKANNYEEFTNVDIDYLLKIAGNSYKSIGSRGEEKYPVEWKTKKAVLRYWLRLWRIWAAEQFGLDKLPPSYQDRLITSRQLLRFCAQRYRFSRYLKEECYLARWFVGNQWPLEGNPLEPEDEWPAAWDDGTTTRWLKIDMVDWRAWAIEEWKIRDTSAKLQNLRMAKEEVDAGGESSTNSGDTGGPSGSDGVETKTPGDGKAGVDEDAQANDTAESDSGEQVFDTGMMEEALNSVIDWGSEGSGSGGSEAQEAQEAPEPEYSELSVWDLPDNPVETG